MSFQVEALASLHHPNLTRLLGYCLHIDRERHSVEQLVVYEFVPGGDLETRMSKGGERCHVFLSQTADSYMKTRLITSVNSTAALHAYVAT